MEAKHLVVIEKLCVGEKMRTDDFNQVLKKRNAQVLAATRATEAAEQSLRVAGEKNAKLRADHSEERKRDRRDLQEYRDILDQKKKLVGRDMSNNNVYSTALATSANPSHRALDQVFVMADRGRKSAKRILNLQEDLAATRLELDARSAELDLQLKDNDAVRNVRARLNSSMIEISHHVFEYKSGNAGASAKVVAGSAAPIDPRIAIKQAKAKEAARVAAAAQF
mmetsp:Transcript_5853/g.14863  ORF Transcript_5853/g.14863 Transcript_5853/m.14863 type:complete len:224 (+) Transcript_5853:498-1169(+)